jgi:hypothetical protein
MIGKKKYLILIIFSPFLAQTTVTAQAKQSKWQIGANAGVLIYQGDLTPSLLGSYKTPGPVFGLYVNKVITPSFALRGNITGGVLRGNDAAYNTPAYRQLRNFSFTVHIAELSTLMVWNMLGNNNNEIGTRLSPYAFAGIGVSFLKINRDVSKLNKSLFANGSTELIGLATDIARPLPNATLVIPAGLGVEYYLSPKFSLTFETIFRYTFTDYLDGFKYAANPAKKDFYHSHTIGLLYKFGGREKYGCPVMNY